MPVSAIYSNKAKRGWTYDHKRKQWRGYLLDAYKFAGLGKPYKRIRIQYATKKPADDAEIEIEIEKKNALLGILKPNHQKPVTVKELLDKRLPLVSPSDRAAAARVFAAFIDSAGGDLLVRDIKTAHFAAYNNARLEAGVKSSTVRREINILSPPFRRAGELFAALEDFAAPRIPRPKAGRETRRKKIITEAEKQSITGYLTRPASGSDTVKSFENRTRIGRMFEIGWLTGLRFSEIARLKITDFSAKQKSLRVVRWKTGNVTSYDFLPDFICDLIKQAIKDSQTEYIFTHSGTRPKDFYPILKEACEASGLAYGRDVENGVVFHATRHAFITRLVQVTDLATARSFSGHNSASMVSHYSHATDESRKSAMEKLYGAPALLTEDVLREIFENILAGRMDFGAFKQQLLPE